MLEIIAGIILFVSCAIALTVVLAGLSVLIGVARGIDTDAFYEEDE